MTTSALKKHCVGRADVGSDGSAAGGGVKRPERVAAVDKIEDKRKPEDFIGHRNRNIDPPLQEKSTPVGVLFFLSFFDDDFRNL